MPFDAAPARIIIESIAFIVMRLNAFLSKNGCSEVYSHNTIFMSAVLHLMLHCKVPFG
jgi:hypothetical protein